MYFGILRLLGGHIILYAPRKAKGGWYATSHVGCGRGRRVAGEPRGARGSAADACKMCPATYIANDEVQAYVKKAIAERLTDQQVRDVEIGKSHIGIGVVHRGKLAAPAPESVAEHDLVSEVYHIIDGSATLMTGPDLVGKKRRPADLRDRA